MQLINPSLRTTFNIHLCADVPPFLPKFLKITFVFGKEQAIKQFIKFDEPFHIMTVYFSKFCSMAHFPYLDMSLTCIFVQFINNIIEHMAEGVESKKNQFKNYLQKTGAVDQLTKVLVQLYQQNERPEKSVEYIRKFLGAADDMDASRLQKDYEDAVEQNEKLKKQIGAVKEEISRRRK